MIKPISERLDAIRQASLGDEYFSAERIAEAAKARLAELRPPAPVEDQPAAVADVESWVDAVLARETLQAQLDKRRNILVGLQRRAKARAASLRSAAADSMLRGYGQELAALLSDVRQLSDQLGDVATAQAAVANDLGPQWKQLTELAADYAVLRREQLSLMAGDAIFNANARGGEEHASDLYLKNLDDLWPSWRTGQNADNAVHIDGRPRRHEPWPQDSTELLVWLVRSDAEPWIPTASDLEQLRKQRAAKRNPLPTVVRGPADLLNKTPEQTYRVAPKLVAAQPQGDTE